MATRGSPRVSGDTRMWPSAAGPEVTADLWYLLPLSAAAAGAKPRVGPERAQPSPHRDARDPRGLQPLPQPPRAAAPASHHVLSFAWPWTSRQDAPPAELQGLWEPPPAAALPAGLGAVCRVFCRVGGCWQHADGSGTSCPSQPPPVLPASWRARVGLQALAASRASCAVCPPRLLAAGARGSLLILLACLVHSTDLALTLEPSQTSVEYIFIPSWRNTRANPRRRATWAGRGSEVVQSAPQWVSDHLPRMRVTVVSSAEMTEMGRPVNVSPVSLAVLPRFCERHSWLCSPDPRFASGLVLQVSTCPALHQAPCCRAPVFSYETGLRLPALQEEPKGRTPWLLAC
ncbi:uncharacterized protein LOC130858904 [Hippopotamus amphibius kiboko]|uniref:uncharacterized protein LOC130858904 n=1 Tax=Hippopotamus amphibius kiboko TaxID=575201 RepID=UPI00259596A0|nr:uncharacterized protein LOC130858904 [Hippopotamus amphibius kiboko]